MLRIWDTFLYEGSKVLFRFALAIFKYNEEKILALDTSIAIFNLVRAMCQDCRDIDRLVQVRRISLKTMIGFNSLHIRDGRGGIVFYCFYVLGNILVQLFSFLFFQIGFYEVKKFSKKWIDTKRAYHHEQLKVWNFCLGGGGGGGGGGGLMECM